ncbi:butyrophilin subfamily 1 member A1 isoform X4 [Camelus dromedarius]|uniref:butyrophilin subfamily 1 member A1 isoform X4 n=1 Tax=Camelus dromedarius TaxID=9838 RepID=UPI003119E2AF
MVIYPIDHHIKLYMKNENYEGNQLEKTGYHLKTDDVDTFLGPCLLYLLGAFFITYVFWKEYHENEKIKGNDQLRKENDQLRKENDQLKKENGNLRKEIGERKAQFRNSWQKTSLYPDWRKEFFQAVNVTLDPVTAHPALILSEKNRRIIWGEKPQDLPEDPQRFYSLPCVLGHQVITSGRCYWEVEVGHSGAWDLGICRSHVMRKGRICIKPEDGFWAIRFYKDEYWALTSPETQLTLKEHPATVCIFLEYEEGRISFYSMTDKSHIHTLSQGSFDGPLRPFFRLWSSDSGHLTICPVSEAAQVPHTRSTV